ALGRRFAGRRDHVAMSMVHKADENAYDLARRAIEDLRTLRDNWDGEGAPRPSKGAIDRAASVVGLLYGDSLVPPPRVGGLPDGGVELAWRRITRNGRLEIEARLQDQGDEMMIGYA